MIKNTPAQKYTTHKPYAATQQQATSSPIQLQEKENSNKLVTAVDIAPPGYYSNHKQEYNQHHHHPQTAPVSPQKLGILSTLLDPRETSKPLKLEIPKQTKSVDLRRNRFCNFPYPEEGPNIFLAEMGIPFVPFTSEILFRKFRAFVTEERKRLNLTPPPGMKPVRLFLGGGNSHMTTIEIQYIIEIVTGAHNVVVFGDGPAGKDVFYVDVHPWDAFRVIRLLHKRVILDETGFYICNTSRDYTIAALYTQTLGIAERVYNNNKNIDYRLSGSDNDPLYVNGRRYQFPIHNEKVYLSYNTLTAIRDRRVRCRPRSFLTISLCGRENENAVDRFCPCIYCGHFFAGCTENPDAPPEYNAQVEKFLAETVWENLYKEWLTFDLGIPPEEHNVPNHPALLTSLKIDYSSTTMPTHANQKLADQSEQILLKRSVKNVLASNNNNNNNTTMMSQQRGDDEDQNNNNNGFRPPNHFKSESIRKSDWCELQLGTLKTVCKDNTRKLFTNVLPQIFTPENIAFFDVSTGRKFQYSECI